MAATAFRQLVMVKMVRWSADVQTEHQMKKKSDFAGGMLVPDRLDLLRFCL